MIREYTHHIGITDVPLWYLQALHTVHIYNILQQFLKQFLCGV